MKTKLRKITIDKLEYLYSVSNQYIPGTETNTLTVKIFLSGQKQTPLVIEFLTLDHYYMGQILKSGISLTNKVKNTVDHVNINEPRYIRELILLGWQHGWIGTNKIEKQNGLNYLMELGYDIDILLPVNKNKIIK